MSPSVERTCGCWEFTLTFESLAGVKRGEVYFFIFRCDVNRENYHSFRIGAKDLSVSRFFFLEMPQLF